MYYYYYYDQMIRIIWAFACISVVYDLIMSVSGTARPPKVLRYVSAIIILTGGAAAWLLGGWQWTREHGAWQPAVPVVRICLLFGIVAMMVFTLQEETDPLWVIIGLPVAALLIIAKVTPIPRRSDTYLPE